MTAVVEFDKDMYHLQTAMERWCTENIGTNPLYKNWVFAEPKSWEGLGNWCMSSIFGNTFFYFKNEKDAMWFKLVWSYHER